jgi:protein ImuB
VGCLWVPDLAVQAEIRADPELRAVAVVIAQGEGSRARLVSVSPLARAQGVLVGNSLSDALALAPGLAVRWLSPERTEQARRAVVDAAYGVSPKVEEAMPGMVWVDASGLTALWGSERQVASALVAAAHRLGFDARASIARGKSLARLAAEQGEGISVVSDAETRAFLSSVPLQSLGAPAHLLRTFVRWGVHTAGELAALPIDGVGTRLGEEAVALHRLASGDDREPLLPLPAPARFEEGNHLDYALDAVEGLLFVLRPVLERLLARLDCYGLAFGRLALHLELDPVGEAVVPLGLAAPTREIPSLIALARLELERHPPQAAVRGVTVVAEGSAVRRQQLGLWDLPGVAPMKVMAAVAQVAAIVGPDRVGQAQLVCSHEPEAHRMIRFEPPPAVSRLDARAADDRPSSPPLVALRIFRPALQAQVRMGPQGPQALSAGSVNGWVVSWAGPWRLDVGWHEHPVRRDGFDVELSDGAVYRVAQDLDTQAWTVVGRYD